MKNLVLFASCLGLLGACAESTSDAGGADGGELGGRGSPSGEAITKTIGPEGGAIESTDGRLALEIPAGALGSETAITVQPITNGTPGGRGLAYRLEPEGITFAEPVQLSFHYGDEELEGTGAGALLVAYQGSSGGWKIPSAPSIDEEARTVTVATSHFSDWSLLAGYQIDPASARLKVGKSLQLGVQFCAAPAEAGESEVLPCRAASNDVMDAVDDWSVNGTLGGAAGAGTVRADDFTHATYTAPAEVPASNPVAVSARLGSALGHVLLVSHVTVIDDEDCGSVRGRKVACGWSGTSTELSTASEGEAVMKTSAQVAWRLETLSDGLAYYVPASGTATVEKYTVIQPRDSGNEWVTCEITLSPPSSSISWEENSATSYIEVDYNTDPPTMRGGQGETAWDADETVACPDETGTNEGAGAIASWLSAYAETEASANGTVFDGSYTSDDGSLSSTWHFTAR